MKRREFLQASLGGVPLLAGCGGGSSTATSPSAPTVAETPPPTGSVVFQVKGVPDQPFVGGANRHAGVDALVDLLGEQGLKLHRSSRVGASSGTSGLIAANDVVLVKVNAQWKYRGCTNSDVVRGLIQRILEHPDGFAGEVVIVDNGQGRGSLNCDTSSSYGGDSSVHANANDERHTFLYLANEIFRGARVSAFLLDPIRSTFIGADEHTRNGYRRYENVSYPCFTTPLGNRVELLEGIWNGSRHEPRLKLLNVPVLKHHDTGGSEITGAVKHFYGLLSMSDGGSDERHYAGLGATCGKMIASVRTPVLNVLDAIWVSHRALGGSPAGSTARVNQLLASQDPVALDYWAAKDVLFPIDHNPRHAPDFSGIDRWLTDCMNTINARDGLLRPDQGIFVRYASKLEAEIRLVTRTLA
jgi:hypothetical protein